MGVKHLSQRRTFFFFFLLGWLGGAWTSRFNLIASAPDAFANLQMMQGFLEQVDRVDLPAKYLLVYLNYFL